MRILWLLLLLFFIYPACTPNNVTVDDNISPYFKNYNVDGCFALLNNSNGVFTVYNLPRFRDSAFLPSSTFKIVNSLIGLQTGIISSDSMIIKWDGIIRPIPEWNRDLSMYQAFRVSSAPWFQELARRIGKDTMQLWLDSISYGTKKIKGPIDSFWLNNTLKITPDEQLGLVKKLYFNQLPFYRLNQEIVKNAMLFENKTAYRLSYKTGLGKKENGADLAWIVGYVEENRRPYFFVLNFETGDNKRNLKEAGMKILKGILTHLGFMQGKK